MISPAVQVVVADSSTVLGRCRNIQSLNGPARRRISRIRYSSAQFRISLAPFRDPHSAKSFKNISDGVLRRRATTNMIGSVRSGLAYGAHLPLIDFDGRGWRPGSITSYARAA